MTCETQTRDIPPLTDGSRLKLLVITMLYEPDCVGIAAIASDMCAALAARGHDVTVYTTYPYYPEWKRKSQVSSWRIQREVIQDVDVRRYGLFVPSNPSRLWPRLLHEVSFPVSLLRSLTDRRQFDVVMAYCPLLGTVLFSALRKLFYRQPVWLNIQDIPVEAATASQIIRSQTIGRVASRLQRSLLNSGDLWSSISPQMVQQLERIKSDHTPVHLCPNWLTQSLQNEVQKLPAKIGCGPEHPPRLLYCGTIGKKQGLLDFCRQLSRCHMDFDFQIRGHGGEAAKVKEWLASAQDSRFHLSDLMSDEEFARAIHAADWFVIPQMSGVGNSFLPSKLIPSVFVGTPMLVVSDNSGPLVDEVSRNELGLVLEWGELDQLPTRLAAFHRDPSLFHALQRNCLEHAHGYRRDHAIDRIESLLRQLISKSRTRLGVEASNGK